jgi:hypothetical protein
VENRARLARRTLQERVVAALELQGRQGGQEGCPGHIYERFLGYNSEGEFVGMDVARNYLQMGYTHSRRYANSTREGTRASPWKSQTPRRAGRRDLLQEVAQGSRGRRVPEPKGATQAKKPVGLRRTNRT